MTPQEINERFANIGDHHQVCDNPSCMKIFMTSEPEFPHCGQKTGPLVIQRLSGEIDDERGRELREFFARPGRNEKYV